MKKRIVVLVVLALLLLVAVAPVGAGRDYSGDRVSLWDGDQTFPAGEPFYVAHGWLFGADEHPIAGGHFDFVLEVDGVVLDEDFVARAVERGAEGRSLEWLWVNNFPEGTSGTHTFTGRWYLPCKYLQQSEPVSCNSPTEQILQLERVVEVTFTE